MNQNLVVVGAGELGCRVAELWKTKFPSSSVFLKTKTNVPARTEKWKGLGYKVLSLASTEEEDKLGNVKAPYVVFCAPPSAEYGQALLDALTKHWKEDEAGAFVFTSSGGVYAENSGGSVDEDSEVKHTDYNDQILLAEKHCVDHGGSAIRLGGLYTQRRGPHNFWLTSGKSPFQSSAVGLINLVHYEEAAEVVVATLVANLRRSLLLFSDGRPISRQEICAAAKKNPLYEDKDLSEFAGEKVVNGKRYNSSRAREVLGWKSKFGDFGTFMSESYVDERQFVLLARQ